MGEIPHAPVNETTFLTFGAEAGHVEFAERYHKP
jgi:hypothetical protein